MLGLDTIARFTWDFGQCFLLEVDDKYYVWSDPDYNGDNTIEPYVRNPLDFASLGFRGRDKGTHTIGGYCGEQVKFIGC